MTRYLQEGKSIDYKNMTSADIKYGDVVVLGKHIAIANCDIKQGETGTVSMSGVYEIKANTEAFVVGDNLYFDTTSNEVTKTATGGIEAGLCIEAKAPGVFLAKVRF